VHGKLVSQARDLEHAADGLRAIPVRGGCSIITRSSAPMT